MVAGQSQSGPPLEVDLNIQVGMNRNVPFHLNSDRNFHNFWFNEKHPVPVTDVKKKSLIDDWCFTAYLVLTGITNLEYKSNWHFKD